MQRTFFYISGMDSDSRYSGNIEYVINVMAGLAKDDSIHHVLLTNQAVAKELPGQTLAIDWEKAKADETYLLDLVQEHAEDGFRPAIVNNLLYPIFGYEFSAEAYQQIPIVNFVHQFSILKEDAKDKILEQLNLSHRSLFLDNHEFEAVLRWAEHRNFQWKNPLIEGDNVIVTYGHAPSIYPPEPLSLAEAKAASERSQDVVYFGLFRFGKGFNDLAELAALMKEQNTSAPEEEPRTLHVCGHVVDGKGDAEVTLKFLLARTYGIPVDNFDYTRTNDLSVQPEDFLVWDNMLGESLGKLTTKETLELLHILQGNIQGIGPKSDWLASQKLADAIIRQNTNNQHTLETFDSLRTEAKTKLSGDIRSLPIAIYPSADRETIQNVMLKSTYGYIPLVPTDRRGINYSNGTAPTFWAHGLVLIAPQRFSTPNAWKDTLIVDAQNPSQAMENILYLEKNKLERDRIVANGLARVSEHNWLHHASLISNQTSLGLHDLLVREALKQQETIGKTQTPFQERLNESTPLHNYQNVTFMEALLEHDPELHKTLKEKINGHYIQENDPRHPNKIWKELWFEYNLKDELIIATSWPRILEGPYQDDPFEEKLKLRHFAQAFINTPISLVASKIDAFEPILKANNITTDTIITLSPIPNNVIPSVGYPHEELEGTWCVKPKDLPRLSFVHEMDLIVADNTITLQIHQGDEVVYTSPLTFIIIPEGNTPLPDKLNDYGYDGKETSVHYKPHDTGWHRLTETLANEHPDVWPFIKDTQRLSPSWLYHIEPKTFGMLLNSFGANDNYEHYNSAERRWHNAEGTARAQQAIAENIRYQNDPSTTVEPTIRQIDPTPELWFTLNRLLGRHFWAGERRQVAQFRHPILGPLYAYDSTTPNIDRDKIAAIGDTHLFHEFSYKGTIREFDQDVEKAFLPFKGWITEALRQLPLEERIEAFCELVDEGYILLNNLHPARDDASRTNRIFCEALANTIGLDMDWGKLKTIEITRYDAVMKYKEAGTTAFMAQVLRTCLGPSNNPEILNLIGVNTENRPIIHVCYSNFEGDAFYTTAQRLTEALTESGRTASIIAGLNWQEYDDEMMAYMLEHHAKPITNIRPIAHVAMPNIGFHNITPGAFSDTDMIVHFHELESRPQFLSQSLAFAHEAKQILVSTELEKRFLLSHAPELADKTHILAMGPNIAITGTERKRHDNPVSFGFIHEKNGLWEVLDFAEELKKRQLVGKEETLEGKSVIVAGGLWPSNAPFIRKFVQRTYDLTNDEMSSFPELNGNPDEMRQALIDFVKGALTKAYELTPDEVDRFPDVYDLLAGKENNRNPLPVIFRPQVTDKEASQIMLDSKYRLCFFHRGYDGHSSTTPAAIAHGNLVFTTLAEGFNHFSDAVVPITRNDIPHAVDEYLSVAAQGKRLDGRSVKVINESAQQLIPIDWQEIAQEFIEVYDIVPARERHAESPNRTLQPIMLENLFTPSYIQSHAAGILKAGNTYDYYAQTCPRRRDSLRDSYVKEALSTSTGMEDPQIVVLIGPPGAGKSTQKASILESQGMSDYVHIDPTDFVKKFPEFHYFSKTGETNALLAVATEAFTCVFDTLGQALSQKKNVMAELMTRNSMSSIVSSARESGYNNITLCVVIADINTCQSRAKARSEDQGNEKNYGIEIPPEDIESLKEKCVQDVKDALDLGCNIIVIENETSARVIASTQNGVLYTNDSTALGKLLSDEITAIEKNDLPAALTTKPREALDTRITSSANVIAAVKFAVDFITANQSPMESNSTVKNVSDLGLLWEHKDTFFSGKLNIEEAIALYADSISELNPRISTMVMGASPEQFIEGFNLALKEAVFARITKDNIIDEKEAIWLAQRIYADAQRDETESELLDSLKNIEGYNGVMGKIMMHEATENVDRALLQSFFSQALPALIKHTMVAVEVDREHPTSKTRTDGMEVDKLKKRGKGSPDLPER